MAFCSLIKLAKLFCLQHGLNFVLFNATLNFIMHIIFLFPLKTKHTHNAWNLSSLGIKTPVLCLFSPTSSLVDSFVLLALLPGADAGWVWRRPESGADSRRYLPSQREAVLLLKLTKNDLKNISFDFFPYLWQ